MINCVACDVCMMILLEFLSSEATEGFTCKCHDARKGFATLTQIKIRECGLSDVLFRAEDCSTLPGCFFH